MSYAGSRMSLLDIQNDLSVRMRQLTVISDLDLSEEDYRYLATKIKMLFKFANDNNVVDDYKLSIVVYWVFSMVYWNKEHLGTVEMGQLFDGLPQYKRKYYMTVCMEAFDEYGIYKYPTMYQELFWSSKAVIARHAGIPKEDRAEVFKTISRYLKCTLIEDMVESVMLELPDKTKAIFCCFDDEMKQKVILNLRNIMIRVLQDDEPKEAVISHYPYVSKGVMTDLMDWCDRMDEGQIMKLS